MGVLISSYSLVTTVVLYNLALVFIYRLRMKNSFMVRCGIEVMLFVTLLAVVRLLSPIDFPQAYVIRSENLVPAVKNALYFSPLASFPAVNLGNLVLCVWLIGTCWFVGKYASELYRALRSRKAYVSVSNMEAERAIEKLGVKYPVVISRQVSSPHTAGFFRPVIYLPAIELPQGKWEYILRHEVQHIRAHDVWIKLFYAMLEAVMWWNPVSHLFMLELDAMLELRCDAAVAIELSESERVEYLTTITAVLAVLQKAPDDSPEMVSAHFTRSEEDFRAKVTERFARVLGMGKQTNRKMKYAAYAVVLALFCLSYFVVVQPIYLPLSERELHEGREEQIDEQFILFDGENYGLYINNHFFGNLSNDELTEYPYNTLPIYGGND